jgi:hypothetical protein
MRNDIGGFQWVARFLSDASAAFRRFESYQASFWGAARELYTDLDEVLFSSKRPVLLNGIDDIATRPDLPDRWIVLTLVAVVDEQCARTKGIWPAFELKRPRIFGGITRRSVA